MRETKTTKNRNQKFRDGTQRKETKCEERGRRGRGRGRRRREINTNQKVGRGGRSRGHAE